MSVLKSETNISGVISAGVRTVGEWFIDGVERVRVPSILFSRVEDESATPARRVPYAKVEYPDPKAPGAAVFHIFASHLTVRPSPMHDVIACTVPCCSYVPSWSLCPALCSALRLFVQS